MIVFRCDGDDRVGAGHVARCVQLALALEAGGVEAVFAGTYSGVAADLLGAAGLATTAPGAGPLGAPAGSDCVVVDSYEIPAHDIERAATQRPVVAVVDDGPAPAATAVLCYHLDAAARLEAPGAALLGPAYAPVAPELTSARRPRGFARALVTMGGGETGAAAAEGAARALLALDPALELTVAAAGPNPLADERVTWGLIPGGLRSAIAIADVAVSAAGSTPYDLAAAGVPAVLHAIAPNQEPVRTAFVAQGLALAREEQLVDEDERAATAAAGPARVDGYGAYRFRDAMLALLAGRAAPRVLSYRPATSSDAAQLRAWRNDPVTRQMSRSSEEVGPDEHLAWLRKTLANPDRTLLLVECEGAAVGTLRFDRGGRQAEISIALALGQRGAGLGAQAISEATELQLAAHPDLERVVAEVQLRNLASLRAFERAGYRMTAEGAVDEGSAVLVRARSRIGPDRHPTAGAS